LSIVTTPVVENKNNLSVKLFTQMEYCEGYTLEDFIKERKKPDRNQNYDIMSQLLQGFASIHGM
jgi:serine/threonine protein kinase